MPLPNTAKLQDVIDLLESTQGINGKTEMASVIGSPTTSNDSIVTQSIKLQNAKNTFANKMDVPNTTPIQEMADLLTFPNKTATLTATRTNANSISISGLDFVPRVVFGVVSTGTPSAYFAASTDSTFPFNKVGNNASLDQGANVSISASNGAATITSNSGYIQNGTYVVIAIE